MERACGWFSGNPKSNGRVVGISLEIHGAKQPLGADRFPIDRERALEAVRLIKNRGVSYVQASQDLSVHTSQLRDWVKKFSDDPQHAFPSIRAGARREAESCPRRSSSPILQNMIFGTHKTSSGGWSG